MTRQPPYPIEQMTADDWEHFLEREGVILVVRDRKGLHYFEHDDHYDELSFIAYGHQGYDYSGSRAALEEVVDNYPEEAMSVRSGPEEFRKMADEIAAEVAGD